MGDGRPVQIKLDVSDELTAGIYSNLVAVWHTPFDFTLDFAVLGQITRDEHGEASAVAPVVARVKIPSSQIFNLAKAIADNVRRYEDQFGPITPPPSDDGPLFPPEEPDQ